MTVKEEIVAEETTQESKKQTVTIEQFEEMRKIQSGLDRTITDLQKQLKQKDEAVETAKKAAEEKEKSIEQRNAEMLTKITERLNQAEAQKTYAENKSLATQLLVAKGLKVPRYIDRLIGKDDAETTAFINAYIDDWEDEHAASKDREAKSKGRKIEAPNMTTVDGMSYADMQALPTEEFNKLPTALVIKAMEAALKQE